MACGNGSQEWGLEITLSIRLEMDIRMRMEVTQLITY